MRGIATDGPVDVDTFRHAGQVAMQLVNKRLGRVWVNDLYLLYRVDNAVLAVASECQALN